MPQIDSGSRIVFREDTRAVWTLYNNKTAGARNTLVATAGEGAAAAALRIDQNANVYVAGTCDV